MEEYEDEISKWEQFKNTLTMLKGYISAYLPLSPLIEEFVNCVEYKKDIEAGNSFRGLLNALGQFLRAFKELIVDGVCWFPRLMRWKTSKGEVAPVFSDYKNEDYNYRLKAKIKAVADGMGKSINEYLFLIVCADMSGGESHISRQDSGFTEEHQKMLDKWQVAQKYREMIESMHVEEINGI